MDTVITVFTPTYNRIKTLQKLYKSLCQQTNKCFCWLIVDDGSTDDTAKYVKNWINENKVEIRYIYQENMGKAMAHNRGVEETTTELFTCVDSDDYLTDDAVETILKTDINENKYIGIVLKRTGLFKEITKWNRSLQSATLFDAYHYYDLIGDTMLVYKTEIIRKYSFPYFKNNKFFPEAYLYDKLDQEGQLKFVDKKIYICEYLQDGYTLNMRKIIACNPKGYEAFIIQRLNLIQYKRSKDLIFDTIRYVSISFVLGKSSKEIIYTSNNKLITLLCLIPGFIFFLINYKKYMLRRIAC